MNLFGDYSSVGTRDEHMLTHSFLEVITYWPKSNKAGDLSSARHVSKVLRDGSTGSFCTHWLLVELATAM
jgi:hypothetical protein